MLSRLLAGLIIASLALLPAFAQEKDKDKAAKDKDKAPEGPKVALKWKFEKEKPFYQKMTTVTKQTMKVMQSDVTQTQNQTFYFTWTPVKQDGDKWIVKQKIDGVVMDIDIGGTKVSYDSTKQSNVNNPLADFFKALVGAEFTLTLDKDLKVIKIEGRDELVKNLTNANPQMKPLLDAILSEKALMEMADPTFAAVPNKEVAKGESWSKETTLDMGPIGKYQNNYKYTFEGKDGALDKIKVEATLTYKEPTDAGVGGLPFRIKGANLKSTGGTGAIFFDPSKGRVEKSDMSLELKGDLSIEIGGQTTKVDLSQTQSTKVETSDKNPIEAPKDAPKDKDKEKAKDDKK